MYVSWTLPIYQGLKADWYPYKLITVAMIVIIIVTEIIIGSI